MYKQGRLTTNSSKEIKVENAFMSMQTNVFDICLFLEHDNDVCQVTSEEHDGYELAGTRSHQPLDGTKCPPSSFYLTDLYLILRDANENSFQVRFLFHDIFILMERLVAILGISNRNLATKYHDKYSSWSVIMGQTNIK